MLLRAIRISHLGVLGLCFLFVGCVFKEKPKPIPEDFVKTIDSSEVRAELAALNVTDALRVHFASGRTTLNQRTEKAIDAFLAEHAPRAVAVLGTAGSEKYRELGEARTHALAEYIYAQGVDLVMLDYQPDAPGKQGMVWVLTPAQVARIRLQAPSLLIDAPTGTTIAIKDDE